MMNPGPFGSITSRENMSSFAMNEANTRYNSHLLLRKIGESEVIAKSMEKYALFSHSNSIIKYYIMFGNSELIPRDYKEPYIVVFVLVVTSTRSAGNSTH